MGTRRRQFRQFRFAVTWMNMNRQSLLTTAVLLAALVPLQAQNRPTLSDRERSISDQMGNLRSLADDQWTKMVGTLARQIQKLPASPAKVVLISQLGNLVTEGDAGHDTLQVVASTMSDVLRTSPADASLYLTLAIPHARAVSPLRTLRSIAGRSALPHGHGQTGSGRRATTAC